VDAAGWAALRAQPKLNITKMQSTTRAAARTGIYLAETLVPPRPRLLVDSLEAFYRKRQIRAVFASAAYRAVPCLQP
jgi:hypothetical protein